MPNTIRIALYLVTVLLAVRPAHADPDQSWHDLKPIPDSEAFELQVVAGSHTVPVIVFFYAEWCNYCADLAPQLFQIASQYEGRIRLVSLDVDLIPETAQRFDVEGIPEVIAFEGGMALTRMGGVPDSSTIIDFFNGYAVSVAEPERTER